MQTTIRKTIRKKTIRMKWLGWGVLGTMAAGAVWLGALWTHNGSIPAIGAAAASAAAPTAHFSETSTFAHISAADPVLRTAAPAGDTAAVARLRDQTATFVGRVQSVFAPMDDDQRVLEFAPQGAPGLQAVLAAADFPAFPDPAPLRGQIVLVTGQVTASRDGGYQVALVSPEQIRIVNQAH